MIALVGAIVKAHIRPRSVLMNRFARTLATLTLLGGLVAGALAPAAADVPGPHPEYLHALSDLRFARALLFVPEENNAIPEQQRAIGQIDRAIDDLRNASIDDGKPLGFTPPVDLSRPRIDRVREAMRALGRAKHDIDSFESNGNAVGWRGWADRHIDGAMHDVRIEAGIDHFDRTGY
jgi:hypothetical protein